MRIDAFAGGYLLLRKHWMFQVGEIESEVGENSSEVGETGLEVGEISLQVGEKQPQAVEWFSLSPMVPTPARIYPADFPKNFRCSVYKRRQSLRPLSRILLSARSARCLPVRPRYRLEVVFALDLASSQRSQHGKLAHVGQGVRYRALE